MGPRCADHTSSPTAALFDQRRGSPASRGYGRTWRKLRKLVLHRDPLCRIGEASNEDWSCKGRSPSVDVHHITRKVDGGPDTMENLLGACHSCHAHVTRQGL